MNLKKQHLCYGGKVQYWQHDSKVTKTPMNFSTFTPAGDLKGVLIWLSGLTCTEENFMVKAGAQKYLAEHGLAVVCPDTSPRGLSLPSEHDSYDFGSGAGFYVDATSEDYKANYKMYTYINEEFYGLIEKQFAQGKGISIFGHSMGGHGALIIGLKNAEKYASVSAFSPIVNPVNCPWGQKAFSGYLGEDQIQWRQYDACELLKSGHKHPRPILVEQGLGDEFYEQQLLTKNFEETCHSQVQEAQINYRDEYDHSYFFISTFVGDHIKFHSQYLQK